MKPNRLRSYLGAVMAAALCFALALRGQDSPAPAPSDTTATKPAAPAVVAPAQPTAQPAAAPAVEAPPAAPAVAPAPSDKESAKESPAAQPAAPEMRRLDTEGPPEAGKPAGNVGSAGKKAPRVHHVSGSGDNAKVSIGHDSHVGKDEVADAAVSILGSTTVDGRASDAAVSIFGTTTVNGSVGDAAVAVFGDTRVNGTVGGDVVAVMGNVDLGPEAVVNGQVVVVGGTLQRDPAAVVHGGVQAISIGHRFPGFGWLRAWLTSALLKGRLLSFASGTGWAWMVAAAFLGLYVLLALIFPRGTEKCAETLEQRPGFTILASLLAMLAIPLVIVLLAITGIGVLVIPFLVIGLTAAKVFGRVVMLAWFGRRITGLFGGGLFSHAAVAVLIGGVMVTLLYLVPILALIVHGLIGMLGLGAVVYTLILGMRRNGAKPTPAVLGSTPVPGAEASAGGAALPPPVISAVTLPHAGFWIRLCALVIDVILCRLVIWLIPWVHFSWSLWLLLLVVYGAVMWKLRGTTVGGSICHLKVVRLDDRPLDWTMAIVRVASCLISLAVVGLGFIWVAFDNEKQSWHDKITGTVVVKAPKGVSLI
jgi:uncharacterized RDD family membrane protein YckC